MLPATQKHTDLHMLEIGVEEGQVGSFFLHKVFSLVRICCMGIIQQHSSNKKTRSMEEKMVANCQDFFYPFLVVEFKADGAGAWGSLWAGTNQCLGGSASCVNIPERLNKRVQGHYGRLLGESDPMGLINSAAFSVVM